MTPTAQGEQERPASASNEVAIVVPCYNAKPHILRALDSVRAQTYQNYSLYVIDDGSDDGTEAVLRGYAGRDRCVRQAHSGAAAARNLGIRISTSPYIAFLDADDAWLPAKLERQVAFLERNPSVGLVCSACEPGEGGASGRAFPETAPIQGRLFARLVRECFIFTPTVLVRRSCVEQAGLFNEQLAVSEDFNLWLRIAARWEIAVLPEALAVRYSRPESLSLATDPEAAQASGIAALRHVAASCSGLSGAEIRALRRAIAERTYRYGSSLLSRGDRANSRKAFSASLRASPASWKTLVKYGLSFFPDPVLRTVLDAQGKAAA